MKKHIYSGVGNPWTSRLVRKNTIKITKHSGKGRQEQKLPPLAQQTHAEIALKRKLDCRKLGRDGDLRHKVERIISQALVSASHCSLQSKT